jgi:hypothetical protein
MDYHMAVSRRSRRTYLKLVLEKIQVKSTRNQRPCVRNLMKVKAKGVFFYRNLCKIVLLATSSFSKGEFRLEHSIVTVQRAILMHQEFQAPRRLFIT